MQVSEWLAKWLGRRVRANARGMAGDVSGARTCGMIMCWMGAHAAIRGPWCVLWAWVVKSIMPKFAPVGGARMAREMRTTKKAGNYPSLSVD